LNFAAIFALLSAGIILLIGYRIYLLDRSNRQYQAFGLLCMCLSWMCFCWYEMEQTTDLTTARYWRKMQSVWAMCNPLMVYCCWLFAKMQLRGCFARWRKVIVSFFFILAFIFWGLELFTETYRHGSVIRDEHGQWVLSLADHMNLATFFRGVWNMIAYSLSMYFIALVWREETDRVRKIWLSIMLLMLSMGILFSIIQNYILPAGGVTLPINESWNVLISVLIFGWALSDFQVFDLKPESAFEHVTNSMANLMIITNNNFRIKKFNTAALKFFNTDAQTTRNAPLEKIIGLEAAKKLTADIQHGNERELAFTVNRQETHFLFSTSIIRSRRKRIVGYVFTGNDLTDFHQTMAEIRSYNERLENSNRSLENFAHVVSHDLKEPLRTINGFVTLLNRKVEHEDDPETLEYMYFINQGIVRMNALIDSILTISRLGSEQEEDESVNLERVVLEIKDKLRGLCSQRNASIHYDERLPHVMGKHHQISLLFQNLIENGIKYNESQAPIVQVGYDQVPLGHQFSITDNGIGISPKYHDHVFQMFKRLHSWADYEGTGIGLTMCRQIVEGLGGRIWIESPANGTSGTVFRFVIPKMVPATEKITNGLSGLEIK
ncbi:MAG: hypothetical protein KDD15_29620, partial [Lewinella sp.]|nr:hypothetical protein [Lewinella sp.]